MDKTLLKINDKNIITYYNQVKTLIVKNYC